MVLPPAWSRGVSTGRDVWAETTAAKLVEAVVAEMVEG